MVLELQLFRSYRAHQARAQAVRNAPVAARPSLEPTAARAKDKIVRALRKKK